MMTIGDIEKILKDGWVLESIHYDSDNNGFVADVSDPAGNICIRGDRSIIKAVEQAINGLQNKQ